MPSLSELPTVPKSLVFMSKDFKTGVAYGAGMVRKLQRLGITLDGNFLDFGCGWGRLTYGLLTSDFSHKYTGIDVLEKRINWLNKNIDTKYPNYEFIHSVQKNDRYRKDGEEAPLTISDVASGKTYKGAFMGSVFTHMWAEDIQHYLTSVAEVLDPDGTFVFTCFALDETSRAACERGAGKYTMPHIHDAACRYESTDDPLFAISYDYDFILSMIEKANLSLVKVEFGTWSGRPGREGQDWFVVRPST